MRGFLKQSSWKNGGMKTITTRRIQYETKKISIYGIIEKEPDEHFEGEITNPTMFTKE
jgi:hypothetical protein